MRVRGITNKNQAMKGLNKPQRILLDRYYNRVLEVEWLASYSSILAAEYYDAAIHAPLLKNVYEQLTQTEPPTIPSKDWSLIGFQGQDPATDLRSMGLLACSMLIFFSTTYPVAARRCLLLSRHPHHEFPFACTAINVGHFTLELLKSHELNSYLFAHGATPDQLYIIFSQLLVAFCDVYSNSNPRNLMDFPPVFNQFKLDIHTLLYSNRALTLSPLS